MKISARGLILFETLEYARSRRATKAFFKSRARKDRSMDSTALEYNVAVSVSLVIALAAVTLCGACVAYAFSHRRDSESRLWSAHCITYALILVLCALALMGGCWCVVAGTCQGYGGLEGLPTYSIPLADRIFYQCIDLAIAGVCMQISLYRVYKFKRSPSVYFQWYR